MISFKLQHKKFWNGKKRKSKLEKLWEKKNQIVLYLTPIYSAEVKEFWAV